jgi:DNA polymerase epsilon subunit 2
LSSGKVFGCPQDAMDQRLHFALERCLRSNLFQSRNSKAQSAKPSLYSLASLEGLSDESVKIAALGHLSRAGDRWLLEDVSTSIALNVGSSVTLPTAGIIGDGCTVVITGRWNGTVFHCDDISLPPNETKETSRSAYRGINLFGKDSVPATTSEDVLVVVSQCHFDRQQALDNLRRVLGEFEQREETDLVQLTFVLVGNFSASVSLYDTPIHMSASESQRGTVNALRLFSAMIVAHTPRVGAHSNFIFIPGPTDATPISGVIPQPPLGEELLGLTKLSVACPKAVFASNPCRLQVGGKEITVCRSDFSRSMSTPCIVHPLREECEVHPFEHIVKTIVDCRHLVPLRTVNPRVVWGLDSTLSLVTLPDLLILADSTDQWECVYAGMKVLNPGSFSSTTAFTWYSASDNEVTFNQLL